MTAAPEAFDRLLYTDCLPGTGRGAGGGFQVQAQSPGVESGPSKLATSSLLYEVQLPWLNQRRPVGEFPLGLAHASGEGYGTGHGRYVGKEAAGGRDGNHVTDCLLTRDAGLYGAIRPAQLWRSPLWRESAWPEKECPQLDAAELEVGPLSVEAVADWARARPERGPALARLVTVLEDPAGPRVVIVSDGPDEAMAWIAAATLLLPTRHALGVSFKVFSSIPVRTEHRIAGAPASLFPQIAPGREGSAFVVDAEACAADEAPVSERAAFYTERFTGDYDAYDVVDAVELADVLDGHAPLKYPGGRDARLTAWALTRPEEPAPEPAALSRWLTSAPQALLDEHGPAVANLVLADAAPDVLRWIDAAAGAKRLAVDVAAVRARLLTAELAEIRRGGGTVPVQDVLPAASLDVKAQRDAESELSSAILLGSDSQADLLLCLARRHGIAPDLTQPLMQQRLRAFAAAWIDRSGGSHPSWWALRAEVLDCAHDELRDRLQSGGLAAVTPAIRRLNRYFGDRVDLSDPLDCHIQASLIAEGPHAGRLDRLRQLLTHITSRTDPEIAASVAASLQRALLEWRAVDGRMAVAMLTELPDWVSVEPVISDAAAQELAAMSQKPSRELLDLLVGLDKRGKAPTSRQLAWLLAEDRQVQIFARRALEEKTRTDWAYLEGTAVILRQVDPSIIRARLDEVLTACLQARHPQLGALVLSMLKSPLPRQLVQRWAETIGTRDPVDDALWCVSCLDYEELADRRQEQLMEAVRGYGQSLPRHQYEAWYDEVAMQVGVKKRDLWESVFRREPPNSPAGPRINLWRNRDGGRS